MNTLILIFLPFGLALALACGVRLALGAERGVRMAGVAAVVAFLVTWGIVLRPGWFAHDAVGRIGHIAVGAALTALLLDFLAARRWWAYVAMAVVVLVSCWASVNLGLWPPVAFTWMKGMALAALAVGAFLVLLRLDALASRAVNARGLNDGGVPPPRELTAPITLAMVCFGLSAVAAVARDGAMAATALALAMAVAGYTAAMVLVALGPSRGLVLGAGATMLAIVWAFADRNPHAVLGLIVLPLTLFAEGTARRVPLPKAGITKILYPLVLAAACALPLSIAVLITLAVRS